MQELDHKAIGLRIRKQRTFLNMSRDELARKIGITPTFLADIELGTKGFSLKSLNRFCDVLKMSADAILYGPKEYMGDVYKRQGHTPRIDQKMRFIQRNCLFSTLKGGTGK